MKTAIILCDGIKQIVFTPENDQEKQALQMFTPKDEIELAVHQGSFGDMKPLQFEIAESKAGYLRAFDNSQSIILVLRPKKKKDDPQAT